MMPVMHEVVLAISSSLVASIVVKATIAMALGLIGAWFARRNRAAVRHALLAASFGVLLVLPVASIVTPPVRIVVPAVAQNGTLPFPLAGVVDAIPPTAPADGRSSIMTANAGSSRFSLSGLLVIVWFAGTMLSLLPMVLAISLLSKLAG